jgi:hypothetical protein
MGERHDDQRASTRRKMASHSGVRAGVSSSALRPNRRRSAGNGTRRAAGGVSFSSHHSPGSSTKAVSSQGERNVSGATSGMDQSCRYPAGSAASAS